MWIERGEVGPFLFSQQNQQCCLRRGRWARVCSSDRVEGRQLCPAVWPRCVMGWARENLRGWDSKSGSGPECGRLGVAPYGAGRERP